MKRVIKAPKRKKAEVKKKLLRRNEEAKVGGLQLRKRPEVQPDDFNKSWKVLSPKNFSIFIKIQATLLLN